MTCQIDSPKADSRNSAANIRGTVQHRAGLDDGPRQSGRIAGAPPETRQPPATDNRQTSGDPARRHETNGTRW